MSEVIKEILMSEILADAEFNCRGTISAIDVTELAKSIERDGLIQPVTVCMCSDEEKARTGKIYKLLAGFRRHMAHRVLSRETVRALVKSEAVSDVDQQFINLAENLQRSQLTFAQECRAIKKLYDLGIGEVAVAERTNTTRGWVQVRYMFLKLPVEIQKEVEDGKINQQQIRAVYTVFKKEGEGEELNGVVRKLKGMKGSATSKDELKDMTLTSEERAQRKKTVSNRAELLAMQEHIRTTVGNNMATRVLAWTIGAISAAEFLKDFAEETGTEILPTMEWDNLIEKNRNA
jgi:ParB/RepB/Spo0J family partition protein